MTNKTNNTERSKFKTQTHTVYTMAAFRSKYGRMTQWVVSHVDQLVPNAPTFLPKYVHCRTLVGIHSIRKNTEYPCPIPE